MKQSIYKFTNSDFYIQKKNEILERHKQAKRKSDVLKKNNNYAYIKNVKSKVCEYYNIDYDVICSSWRKREVVLCRQIIFYLLKESTQLTFKEIGKTFEHKEYDHSTVIHSYRTIQALIDTDLSFSIQVQELKQIIGI